MFTIKLDVRNLSFFAEFDAINVFIVDLVELYPSFKLKAVILRIMQSKIKSVGEYHGLVLFSYPQFMLLTCLIFGGES